MRTRWPALLALAVAAACARSGAAPKAKPAAAGPSPSPAASPASYEVRLGHAVYQHYCETCHGAGGAGDGFNAFNLDPHPRDLSDPAFQRKKTDADLADAIERGGAGVGLSALMPPWGHTLSKREVADVVLYLRTLSR